MGVYTHNIVDKKFIANIMKLAEERDIAIIVKEYESYFKLLDDCNNYQIDFAILPEDFFIDSCLGLNVFKERTKINNHYVISLYFNYLYFLSEPFYIDRSRSTKFTRLSQLVDFKKIHKRNYIVGTEEPQSNSYMNMILIFNVFGLNPINFDEYSETETETDINTNIKEKNKQTIQSLSTYFASKWKDHRKTSPNPNRPHFNWDSIQMRLKTILERQCIEIHLENLDNLKKIIETYNTEISLRKTTFGVSTKTIMKCDRNNCYVFLESI